MPELRRVSALPDLVSGMDAPSAVDADPANHPDLDHLWLPERQPKPSGPDFFNDPAILLRSFDHAVVRALILISLIMLAFAAGIVLGQAVS